MARRLPLPWAYDQRLLEHAGAIGGRIIAPPAVNFPIVDKRLLELPAATLAPAGCFDLRRVSGNRAGARIFQACLSDAFRGVPSREPLCRQTRKADPYRDEFLRHSAVGRRGAFCFRRGPLPD